ncbi:Hypothetical predicted protein [Olea europaea subsp. europaea]|uniref:Uncharacterized protein n=1 Tax=Olea europaea subsp. europaea TaxID=158383 RepID=A0A8S0PQY6_OLEEU|nr:Hypothetical predicted protein [Olea europaea subsp. europaea]
MVLGILGDADGGGSDVRCDETARASTTQMMTLQSSFEISRCNDNDNAMAVVAVATSNGGAYEHCILFAASMCNGGWLWSQRKGSRVGGGEGGEVVGCIVGVFGEAVVVVFGGDGVVRVSSGDVGGVGEVGEVVGSDGNVARAVAIGRDGSGSAILLVMVARQPGGADLFMCYGGVQLWKSVAAIRT